MIKIKQVDDESRGKFIIYEDNKIAGEMTYSWAGDDKFIIDHTGVKEAFGGKGYGKQLVMRAVEFAREQKVKILPLCPFAKKVFDRNEDIQDVRF